MSNANITTSNANIVADGGPYPPKVTDAEALLYSYDLAGVVRMTGSGVSVLHDCMLLLSRMINNAVPSPDDGAYGEMRQRWVRAFTALAAHHDGLMDAYREIVKIALEAAEAEQYHADTEASLLVRKS